MLLLLLHSQGAQPCSTTLMFLCLKAFPGNSKGPCSFWAANIVRIWGNFSSLLRPAGCLPLHTAFFSARRCLVSGKLKTLMAGYMRFLNDFPSSHAHFNCALSQLCCVTNCVPANQRYKCTLHRMAYISAINSYFQHNPSSGSYSKT